MYAPAGVDPWVVMVIVEVEGPLVALVDTLPGENTVVMPTPAGFFAWRVILSENPFRPVKVIAEVALALALTEIDVRLALCEKFGGGTVTVTFTLWVSSSELSMVVPLTVML